MKQSAIERRRKLRQVYHEVGRLSIIFYLFGMLCFYLAFPEYMLTLAYIWFFISFVLSYLVYFVFIKVNKSRDGDY